MINLKSLLQRPLGLIPLLMVLLTLFVLTAMLVTMIAGRLSILENGTKIILKTAPIDPRDLLRGYFVRLGYEISRLAPGELEDPMSPKELVAGFKKHTPIFVKLRADREGFWSPVSLHRAKPKAQTDIAIMRGWVRYDACLPRYRLTRKCNISIRYGIEKFFAEKARTRKLEDFGRQTSSEIKALQKQVRKLRKSYVTPHKYAGKPEPLDNKKIPERLSHLREKLSKLVEKNRLEMTKRFAIIVRLDKHSGEAAISGLQLDGKQIYEERLF